MKELMWANLKARPIRTALSVLAVTLQVFLLLFLMGLTDGIVSEWGERVKGIGADLLVQSPNASIFIAISSPVLPQEMANEIAAVEGVIDVAPVLTVVSGESLTMIYGIDYDTFNRLGSGFLFHQGGPFQERNDVIVDDIKAASKNLNVGDTVELLGEKFRVCGIVEHGRGARYFIPLATAQELVGAEQRVSMFWVQSSGNPRAVHEKLALLFPRHRIRLMEEYLSLMVSSNLPEIRPFTRAVVLVGILISFMVVLLSMYTIVLERTREIGILKALGASRWNIVGMVLRESLAVSFLGILLGVAASYGVKFVVTSLRPTMRVLINPEWLLLGAVFAIVGCILGSVYPALRAAAADPVAALTHE
ncbi:MAG TPA: FtsX-like permease family protein [Candidatus Xenobia bacterium]|nr:FtsX-like permease family protein [Candidatus Xenobia bacterium]